MVGEICILIYKQTKYDSKQHKTVCSLTVHIYANFVSPTPYINITNAFFTNVTVTIQFQM